MIEIEGPRSESRLQNRSVNGIEKTVIDFCQRWLNIERFGCQSTSSIVGDQSTRHTSMNMTCSAMNPSTETLQRLGDFYKK